MAHVLIKHEMMVWRRRRFLSRYPQVNWHSKSPVLRVGLMLGIILASLSTAESQTFTPRDLTQFSLEDLMNVQITSVSKKEQKLAKTGAAIFVITQEDIRRSGATNIPDLLRMVPGLEVAQINPSTWAISARGFNGEYSNKLLVLIDGRTVYTP